MDGGFDAVAVQCAGFVDAVQALQLFQSEDLGYLFGLQCVLHVHFIRHDQYRYIMCQRFLLQHHAQLLCCDVQPHSVCSVHHEDDAMHF